jgi:zinc protease
MVGLAALSASLKATSTATAATAATTSIAGAAKSAATNSLGGLSASTVKSTAMAGVSTGFVGSLFGVVGGLGGAFIGCWLPAQLANTLEERKLMQKHGRRSFAIALLFTLAMLLASPLLSITNGLAWYFSFVGLITLVFVVCLIRFAAIAQAEIRQLQATLAPDAELNPSPLRRRVGLHMYLYRGRSFTSRWSLLGIPLIDIQFNDCFCDEKVAANPQRRAFGWIAIGDQATGILIAVGGIAKGLIAIGGVAIGGIAVGGAAVGGLAIGGGALGWLAFGGGAIGYDAVGGLAIAWHVATGGGAIAYHLAVGGGAWAHDYAVGGGAWAREANTEIAKQLANTQSMTWMLEWLVKNRLLFITTTMAFSLLPVVLMRFAYRRELR